jgi:hypothetical protein
MRISDFLDKHGVVVWTPTQLIPAAACVLEDAINAVLSQGFWLV